MYTYIFLEDANSVLKSTYQKEDTSIEPESTRQGIVHTYIHKYIHI